MSRTKSSDIILNSIPFMIYRDGKVPGIASGTFGPVDATQEQQNREVPILMGNFSGGMGVCREIAGVENAYAFGTDVCTRNEGVVLPAGKRTAVTVTTWEAGGKLVTSLWWLGHLYLFTQRYILRMNYGTETPVQVHDVGTTKRITSAVVYNGKIVVAGEEQDGSLWRSMQILTSLTGTVWTSGTMRGRLLAVVYWVVSGIGKHRLITTTSGDITDENTGASIYRHSYMRTLFGPVGTDVTDETNWTAVVQIGDSSYDIMSIAYANQKVWFVKTEGICDVDQRGYSPVLTTNWRRAYSAENGICSLYHDGWVYGAHVQGLDRYDTDSRVRDDDPDWVSPGYGLSNHTPIFGQVQALTVDDGWVVAAVYNGTDSFVCYGKDRTKAKVEGPTAMVWHGSECTIRGEKITHLNVITPAAAQPYMLIGTLSGSTFKMYKLSLPNASNSVQEIIKTLLYTPAYSHEFATSFRLFMTTRTWKDVSALKVIRSFDFISDMLNSLTTNGSNVRAFANADGGFRIWQDDPMRRTSVTPPDTGTYTIEFDGYVSSEDYTAEIDAPDWDEFVDDSAYRTAYAATVQSAIDDAITNAGATLTATVTASVVNSMPVLVIDTGTTDVAVGSSDATVLWDYQGVASTSPREVFLPSSSLETGYQISICLVGQGTASAPPLIYNTKIRAEVIVDQLEIKTYRLIIGDQASLLSGARNGDDTREAWARLWTLQNRGPVDLNDEWDEDVQAKVEPPIKYEEVEDTHGQGILIVATVQMSILRRGAYWETGFTWGDPVVWS